jgi:hypothetical protein
MKFIQFICILVWVASSSAIAAATNLESPEKVVSFYLDAVRREAIEEMLSVRDFRRQAYSDLYESLQRKPDAAAVETKTRQLKDQVRKSILPPKLGPRTCRNLTTRYETNTLAQVTGVCERTLGGGLQEQSVVNVVLAQTNAGWRIVNSGADE